MKKGFTLVELLAVIVILAVILVIAVPKITATINSTRKAAFESSIKMVAKSAEREYTVAQTLGTAFTTTAGTNCLSADWAGLNADYSACTYGIDTTTGVATVTLTGDSNGKFKGCTGAGNKSAITTPVTGADCS